ncbi:hypothetical protein GCM10023258_28770 [Terrabacter aeriphilus]|uniref:Sortase family protein n=1 Tax=Terrabacter aeriphilus TaxID=515662 RepID=A0ABP9JIH2_9MICO
MTDPSDHDSPAPGSTGSSARRRVAAAVAAALLAGAGTAWLTRPNDPVPTTTQPVRTSTDAVTPDGVTPGTAVSGSAVRSPADRAAARRSATARSAAPAPAATVPSPDRLRIGRLGVDMRIVPVGVSGDGEMALPSTPALAGWYAYGPRPGERSGATVLAAHLDMPGYGIGPIAGIGSLRRGDVLSVRSGPTVRSYTVTSVESTRKTALDLDALFARDGPARLHVVTCGGDFDREARRYDENVVVTAEPTA